MGGGGGQGSHGELSIDLEICSYLQFYCPCQYFAVISLTTNVSFFLWGGGGLLLSFSEYFKRRPGLKFWKGFKRI